MDNDGKRPLFSRPSLALKTQDAETKASSAPEDKTAQGKQPMIPSGLNPESNAFAPHSSFGQASSLTTQPPSHPRQFSSGFSQWANTSNAGNGPAASVGSSAAMTFGQSFPQPATQDASKWWVAGNPTAPTGSFAAWRESVQSPQSQAPTFGQPQALCFRPPLGQIQSPRGSSQWAGGAGNPPGAGGFQSRPSMPVGKENIKPSSAPWVVAVETERATFGQAGSYPSHPSSTIFSEHSSAPSAMSVARNIPLVPLASMQLEDTSAVPSAAVSKRKRESSDLLSEEGGIADASPMQVAVVAPTNGTLASRSFPKLSRALTQGIDDRMARFYFGVLATQALLLPRFKFQVTRKKPERWGVTLTVYGRTFPIQFRRGSRMDAKSATCRDALTKLQNEYQDWTVPGEPAECPIPLGWDWIQILRDFCIQNGLPAPKYTGGLRRDGYLHEVEIGETSYLGALEHYAREWDSKNSAAHVAMHSILVSGWDCPDDLSPQVMLRNADENMLALVPRKPPAGDPPAVAAGQKRPAESNAEASGGRKKAKTAGQNQSTSRVENQVSFGSMNANTLPLTNCRLVAYEKPLAKEEPRWKYTHREIRAELTGMHDPRQRLEKTCRLLSLEFPRTDVQLHNVGSETTYNAATYFSNDPFLARVGPIGEVKYARASNEAVDACCAETVEFLIDMVRKDLEPEQPEPMSISSGSKGSSTRQRRRTRGSRGSGQISGLLGFDA